MKVLIIYSHPDTVGFSSYSLEEVKRNLALRKVDFKVIDLYKINYDPVLKINELYTVGNREISLENKQFQQEIKNSDAVIFIYPIWWGGMPAILKGFMDRVFTPGFAFKYRNNKFFKFIPDKLLNDKKIIIFASSGAPRFVYKILLEPIKLINKFVIFGLFSLKLKTYQIYGASSFKENRKREIEKVIKKGINWLLK
jgi:NAD(P)H dehydrogenase (quinone)